jgi:LPS O-antigen subunit length determinant protein (WzzB/FepE family)
MTTKESIKYYQRDELSLKQILIFLYSGKWFFILVMLVSAFATYSYVQKINPTFEATIKYREPSQIVVSKINFAKFNDESVVSGLREISAQEIFEMFNHKVSSYSFREKVFREKGYKDRANIKSGDFSDIYSFIGGVTLDRQSSSNSSSVFYFKGSEPSILSDYLNDLIFEANRSVLEDLKQIEMNIVLKKIESITSSINRLQSIEIEKNNQMIMLLEKELTIADSIKNENANFKIVENLIENTGLFGVQKDAVFNSPLGQSFPYWYFFGADFIELEIEKLELAGEVKGKQLIEYETLLDTLEAFDFNIDGINSVDIIWSLIPNSPIEPKKKLIMAVLLSISLLFSIFIWYVVTIFRLSH